MSTTRRARVRALAKINLDLRVLGKRPDGYHELRTIFQTISLADTIDIAFTPGRKTSIELEDALGIADNLVTRAARLVMEACAPPAASRCVSRTHSDGGRLGGGSSDAAAVLLALPVLTGRPLPLEIMRIGPATRQRRSFLPPRRTGGRDRTRLGAVSLARRPPVADFWWPPTPCGHRQGLPRPEPSFDNRIITK